MASISMIQLVIMALAATPAASVEPIVSTKLVYGITGLYSDIYDTVHSHFIKDSQVLKLTLESITAPMPGDPLKVACEKLGCDKQIILLNYNKQVDTVMALKTQAVELLSQAYVPANKAVGTFVGKLEVAVPATVGRVPKTLEDFLLFAVYMSAVLYIILRVVKFVLKIALGLFCCFFCCRCCRSGKAATTEGKKKKTGAELKAAAKKAGKK